MNYYSIEAKNLSPQKTYYHLISAINPRPIAWVSTVSASGIDNLAPFSFFNAFSADPPIVGFCPSSKADGSLKDTHQNLIETREAVINMVPAEMLAAVEISSQNLAAEENEIEIAKLETLEADLVKAKRIKACPIQLEVKLLELINFRRNFNEIILSHQNFQEKNPQHFSFSAVEPQSGTGNLIICEILKFHIDESLLNSDKRIQAESANFIGRAGADFYTESKLFRSK